MGASLGLLGAGGSIIMLPVLVYVVVVEPHAAVPLSLAIVGTTSQMSVAVHSNGGEIRWGTALLIGGAALGATYVGSRLTSLVPGSVLLPSYSAQRMTRMIADLLDLTRTRLGAGIPIVRRPMDLHAICEDVALELKAFHPDAELECRTEGDLTGEWDSDRLTQVVSNLVGNALQHGDGRGVDIETQDAGDEVLLRVHNTGRAIPAGIQTSMFEPLTR